VPGPTPHYPPEFKREAVKLYRSSEKSIPKMAEELGIAGESLRRWIRQHQVDEGEREGLTTSEREELSKLRRESKTFRQEREFLKKSGGGFNRSVQHDRFLVLFGSEVREWRGWGVQEGCLQ
jgi:transposase